METLGIIWVLYRCYVGVLAPASKAAVVQILREERNIIIPLSYIALFPTNPKY